MNQPATARRTRNVTVVDNSHVARRVGERIRQVRTRVGLTQAQVAKGRYTAAYISALERGLAKPSMAALTFLSERLGVPVTDLVAEERPAVGRLEADLMLAAGNPQEALDRYDQLLEQAGEDRRNRAELLRRQAEALCRLGKADEAVGKASESAESFEALGLQADAAWARYWLAFAHYQLDNPTEARDILLGLLALDRAGVEVAADFRFRLLAALGNVEAWDGESERALTYMEEARSLVSGVTLQQRAAFLSGLALQYRRVGDLERSLRVGYESLALYQAAESEREQAALEINLALVFIQIGNLDRASEHLTRAREIAERTSDSRLMSDVYEAEAQLAFERRDLDVAQERALAAIRMGREGRGSYLAAVGGHVTLARIAREQDNQGIVESEYENASALLREHGARTRLKDVLAEWADYRTHLGDHAGANVLYAKALGRGSGVRLGR